MPEPITIRKAAPADIPHLMEIRASVRENRLATPGLVTQADYDWFIAHGPTWVVEQSRLASEPARILGFAASDPRN